MMLVDQFRADPLFPFQDYATDIRHFIGAQGYWLALLRALPEFDQADWQPVQRPVDVLADQLSGLMLRLQNTRQARLLTLHTNSFEGCVVELIADNPPMTQEEVTQAKGLFDWQPDAETAAGLTPDSAIRVADQLYHAFRAPEEPAEIYIPDAGHPDGGYILPARRLFLQSEVSRDCEPRARAALARFMKTPVPGT